MEKSEKECGTDESIIARLRGTERQMEAKERELRQAVKAEEEIIAEHQQELDRCLRDHSDAKVRLGYVRIERLAHEVIADCRLMIGIIERAGGGAAAITEAVIPFIEDHLGFDSHWDELHRTLKTNKLPPGGRSILPVLSRKLGEAWKHLERLAPSAEMRKAYHSLSTYIMNWHAANRPNKHWNDKSFVERVDSHWAAFRATLEPLVEHLRATAMTPAPTAEPAANASASARMKPERAKPTAKDVRLIARRGIVMPYEIDPANRTIKHKATGKSYYISGGLATSIVNRLTGGMVKGIKCKTGWSVPFTDADVRVFRKGRLDDLAAFLHDCVKRDPFQGHRIGNRRFADTAQLAR